MAGVVGFEPTTSGFGDQRSAAELYSYNRKRMMKIIRHLEPFLHMVDRHGANGGARTHNLSVNSRLLCRWATLAKPGAHDKESVNAP